MTEKHKSLVLLVDDTPGNINLLVNILDSDYDLAVATDGEQALAMVKETPPDLILLDVMMPGIDGYEVCRRLKKNPATHKIPVIFLTAKAGSDDIVNGFEVGAVDYVAKPFQAAELKARVRTNIQLQQLKSLLSICAYCHKIRDGDEWEDVALYFRKKTGTQFSHGACPECFKKAIQELKNNG